MAKGFKSIFSVGDDILYSEASLEKKNTILVQLGDATCDQANQTGSTTAEWWQHVGFASRPSPVSGDGKSADAAQGVTINRTDFDVVIASRDTRYQEIYGNLKPGETSLYATGSDGKGQARILLKDDGSLTLFTKKNNQPSGVGLGLFINAKDDSVTAINSTGSALMLDSSGAKLLSKDGAITIDSGALKLSSKGKINIAGPSIVLGGSAALPALNVGDLAALIAALSTIIPAIAKDAAAPAVPGMIATLAGLTAKASIKRTSLE